MTSLPRLLLITLFTALLFSNLSLYAQAWTQKSRGISGLTAKDILVWNDTVFVTSNESGIYKMSDQTALEWKAINKGLPSKRNTSFAVKGDSLFVCNYGYGVYVSTDGGETWAPTGTGLEGIAADAILFVGSDLFLGTQNGVYKSSDMGKSWMRSSNGIDENSTTNFSWILSLYANDNFIFAGSFFGGAFRSADSGLTWQRMAGIPSDESVFRFASKDNLLFLAGTGSMNVSADNGSSWTALNVTSTEGIYVYDVAVFKNDIYAATSNGFYRSSNNGSSFIPVNVNGVPGYFDQFTSLESTDKKILVNAQVYGLFESEDGQTWKDISKKIPAVRVDQVIKENDVLYATGEKGSFKSLNDGDDWAALEDRPYPFTMLAAKRDSLFALVLSGGQGFVSANQGKTWDIYFDPNVSSIIMNTGTEGFFVRNNFSGLYEINPANNSNEFLGDLKSPVLCMTLYNDTLIVGLPDSTYSSYDRGNSWKKETLSTQGGYGARTLFHFKKKIYASTGLGIYSTGDNLIDSWKQLPSPGPQLTVLSFAADDRYLFAGTASGVYFSPDEGRTWIEYNNENLREIWVYSLLRSGKSLIAATSESMWSAPVDSLGPRIDSFEPLSGETGTTVTLHGKNFSSEPSLNTVTINGLAAHVLLSTPTIILLEIPPGASPGKFEVVVNNSAGESSDVFCANVVQPVITVSESATGLPVLISSITENIQWYKSGELIIGEDSATYQVLDGGDYSLRTTNTECVTEASYQITITGFEALATRNEIHVFPNPVTETVQVKLSGFKSSTPLDIVMYDQLGSKRIKFQSVDNREIKFSVQQLPPGIYFLKVSQGAFTKVVRLSKQ
jgi:photosystem II stability/assembly factor-like uncharacterized protein